MVVSFFGHKKIYYNDLDLEQIISTIEVEACGQHVEFFLGGFGNFDAIGLRCAQLYKKLHPETKLVFITPYIHENYCLLQDAKEIYDEVIYPELELVPPRYAIPRRNRWMVNESDFIIFYVISHFGGAYDALRHAQSKKKKYINLYQKA